MSLMEEGVHRSFCERRMASYPWIDRQLQVNRTDNFRGEMLETKGAAAPMQKKKKSK